MECEINKSCCFPGSKFQAIKSFSVKQNAIKLFSTQHSDSDAIDCLHGIRVIQSLCLVSGHTGFMYVALPVTNGAALLTVCIIKIIVLVDQRSILVIYFSFEQSITACFGFHR